MELIFPGFDSSAFIWKAPQQSKMHRFPERLSGGRTTLFRTVFHHGHECGARCRYRSSSCIGSPSGLVTRRSRAGAAAAGADVWTVPRYAGEVYLYVWPARQ